MYISKYWLSIQIQCTLIILLCRYYRYTTDSLTAEVNSIKNNVKTFAKQVTKCPDDLRNTLQTFIDVRSESFYSLFVFG